ncbi:MAG: alpha/beta fold hydrolase [Rhodospirillales bacterium]|nr:alpha/beta fold hydrolase [Rhodospirillales bacterium]
MAERTFVLVHGAFHGGWCWRRVAGRLRAAGHRVFTPTLTGLGARRHLLSTAVTLETFITDVVNLIEFEELEEAVLVGHSFAGIAISGAADRVPRCIRHLVYLDSLILEHGEAPFDIMAPAVVEERIRLARETSGGLSIPPPAPSAFGVPDGPDAEWVARHLTPHPFATYSDRLRLAHPAGNGLPRTYICCTDPIYVPLEAARRRVKASTGWGWREIPTGHDAMVTMPGPLAGMLIELAAEQPEALAPGREATAPQR